MRSRTVTRHSIRLRRSPVAVDCQGLAGGFTLGTVQAGFDLLAKLELPGGFGMENCISNRDELGPFIDQVGPWEEWEPFDGVDYLFGNPPCSGFSLMNTAESQRRKNPDITIRNHRGWDSPINDCMWALIHYAGRVNNGAGPRYLAMESVQQAYRKGRNLMQMLRERLEDTTQRKYDLHHVLMSGASVGAAQWRKRYFMVLTKEPFQVEKPEPRTPITYREALSDLQQLDWKTWKEQQYVVAAQSSFQVEHRSFTGKVRDHFSPNPDRSTKHITQVFNLLDSVPWNTGEEMVVVLRRYYDKHGKMPEGFDEERILRKEWKLGFHQPKRIDWDKPGYVVTGAGGVNFIHPNENRFLTVRECARLQGFPDTWTFSAATSERQAYSWIGKGVPVESGFWLSTQIGYALDGIDLGFNQKDHLIGEREYLWDYTNAWKE